jgi:hypothetical protein
MCVQVRVIAVLNMLFDDEQNAVPNFFVPTPAKDAALRINLNIDVHL